MAALEHDMGPETLTLSRGKFTMNLSNIQTYWNISLLNCRCQTSLWTARKITKKQILWWGPCNKTSCTAKSSTIWIFERCQGSLWTCLWNCRCSGQSWNSCFSHCQGKIPRKTLKWPWELTIEFFELFLYKLWFYLIFLQATVAAFAASEGHAHPRVVELPKTDEGLGFNVMGGKEQNSPIYISRIIPGKQ